MLFHVAPPRQQMQRSSTWILFGIKRPRCVLALTCFHQSADVKKDPPPHPPTSPPFSVGSMVVLSLLKLRKDNPNARGINLAPDFTVEPRGW